MKRFIHWLKQISQRRSAVDKSMGEGDPNRPFGWFGDDQADSSIFITGSLTTKKSETKVSDEAPGSGYTTLCDAENDEDFDPYNSGRFNSK